MNGKVRVSCTEAELQEFLDRVITLQSYPIEEDENATTDEGTVHVILLVNESIALVLATYFPSLDSCRL